MDLPPSKKRKVEVACTPCRIRKAKCDGQQPVCGTCLKRRDKPGPDCTWSVSSHRLHSEQEVRWLRARLKLLEGDEQHSSDNNRGENASFQTSGVLPHEAPLSPRDAAAELLALNSNERYSSDRQRTATTTDSDVCPVIGPTEQHEGTAGFYGSSSAGSFMQSVSTMVDGRIGGAQVSSAPPLQGSYGGVPSGQIDDSLPPRQTADHLMDIYWRSVFPLYPFLDPRRMQKDYQLLWSGERQVDDASTFLCLLNSIFALSTQIDPNLPPQERGRLSNRFYQRARSLVNIFQPDSVANVQALLMLGLYCQSSNENNYCWTLTGLAIRIAHGLGLHASEARERDPDPAARELLHRVWYSCVLLDRTLAMNLGRPCMIGGTTATTVNLPSEVTPLYDQDIADTYSSPQSAHWSLAVKLDFFKSTLELHEILHHILQTLGSCDLLRSRPSKEVCARQTDPSRKALLDLERELQEWHDEIPMRLRARTRSSAWASPRDKFEEDVRVHQAVVLEQMYSPPDLMAEHAPLTNLRYLHVRLILLRPFLSHVVALDQDQHTSDGPHRSLFYNVALQCAVSCVHVAQDTTRLVHDQQTQAGELATTAPWWCNVLFLHGAATVHIAAQLSPSILHELSEASISETMYLETMYLGLNVLQTYASFGNSVDRLVMRLRMLTAAAVQRRDQTRPRPTADNGRALEPSLQMQPAQDLPTAQQPFDFMGVDDGFWDEIWNSFDLIDGQRA